MSSLDNTKPSSANHVENGHASALRLGAAFIFDPQSIAIGIGATTDVRFVTGDNATIFEGAAFGIDQELVTFQVFEDVVFSAPGTISTTIIRKANRLSAREPQIDVYTGPTVDTLGPIILHDILRGTASQGQNKPGFGSGSQDVSIILKPNTEHVFRITNGSAAIVNVEPHVFYREEDPRQYADIV